MVYLLEFLSRFIGNDHFLSKLLYFRRIRRKKNCVHTVIWYSLFAYLIVNRNVHRLTNIRIQKNLNNVQRFVEIQRIALWCGNISCSIVQITDNISSYFQFILSCQTMSRASHWENSHRFRALYAMYSKYTIVILTIHVYTYIIQCYATIKTFESFASTWTLKF